MLRAAHLLSALALAPAPTLATAFALPLALFPLVLLPLLTRTLPSQERHIHTDRPAPKLLPLPKQDDCFFFAIFGDRTGGQPAGLKVLRQAVADTNLLDPDLVMTVGDLVQGYNKPAEWLKQTKEFKVIMAKLKMAWFPVAGNHDTYSRNKQGQLVGGNAKHYEKHFGPLWYWFEHKNCAFVVLYSDEGDPTSNRVGFQQPLFQQMSPEQLAWLKKTLAANEERDHVFVFLHHPRWHGGQYGDDWDKVHKTLVAAGNVSAVFAGHIHRMVYAGKKDGIEYFTLATTGGSVSQSLPERAGWLHHFNIVTVRKNGIAVSTIPVGAVLDPRQITQEVSADVRVLNGQLPRATKPIALHADGRVDGLYTVTFSNPAKRPADVTLIPECRDPRWRFSPDHQHALIPPGEERKITFAVKRPKSEIDAWFAIPDVRVQTDYLGENVRISLREKNTPLVVDGPAVRARFADDGFLGLTGRAHLELPKQHLELDGKALTVECWVRSPNYSGTRTLVSDRRFQLLLVNGRPEFHVLTDKGGSHLKESNATLKKNVWHHIAAVFGNDELRLFVDGRLVADGPAKGVLGLRGGRSLFVGAGFAKNRVVEFARVHLDELRISTSARYSGDTFVARDRRVGFESDASTALLLPLDRNFGPWAADYSRHHSHPMRRGGARCVKEGASK